MRAFPYFAALLLSGTPALAAAPVEGLWLTQDGKGLVRIARCGERMCGRIERVLDRSPNAPTHDVNNRDPSLRNRPLVGLLVLTGLRASGGGWTGGQGYDPYRGRQYAPTIGLNPDGSLRLTGCVRLLVTLCRNYRWTRAR